MKGIKLKVLIFTIVLTGASLAFVLASQLQPAFHGVGVLKSTDSFAYVGDLIKYQIRVYNPSDYDLYNINVTDTMLEFNDTIPFMAKGNTTGLTYIFHREVLGTDPNPLVNTVSVEAVDSEGVYSSASTQAITTILERLIDIEKTGVDFAHEGDAIKYTIVVTNLADFPIANVTVEDEMMGFSWRGDLAVGESNVFNLTYVVPADVEDHLRNKITASAELNESRIYAEDTWTVDILHPKLEVDKTVEPVEIYAGENVTYTIVTTNTGDTTLFNLTLTDSIYGSAPTDLVPSSLLPEDSFAWSFNTSIYESMVNVVKATAVDILGKEVSDCDEAFVEVKPTFCPRSMGYWKNHPEAWPVDEIEVGNVNYTKEEALMILIGANAKDATRMLAAQLIATKLNRISGASPCFFYEGIDDKDKTVNIDVVISEADAFLAKYPVGSDPRGDDRQYALQLKDLLDAYNNSKCD